MPQSDRNSRKNTERAIDDRVECPRCRSWTVDGDTFCGKEILTITTRCYLCGNQKRITPELAAAHQLLRSVHNDYPGSLQIGMPTITALYHSGLLPKKAHEIVRPYIEGNRIEDAIRSEGMQIVCAEEEVDEW